MALAQVSPELELLGRTVGGAGALERLRLNRPAAMLLSRNPVNHERS